MQLLATLSNSLSTSAAHRVNGWPQNAYLGFLISSMNVTSRPHGCGLLTTSRSSRTRVTASCNPGARPSPKSESTRQLK